MDGACGGWPLRESSSRDGGGGGDGGGEWEVVVSPLAEGTPWAPSGAISIAVGMISVDIGILFGISDRFYLLLIRWGRCD